MSIKVTNNGCPIPNFQDGRLEEIDESGREMERNKHLTETGEKERRDERSWTDKEDDVFCGGFSARHGMFKTTWCMGKIARGPGKPRWRISFRGTSKWK